MPDPAKPSTQTEPQEGVERKGGQRKSGPRTGGPKTNGPEKNGPKTGGPEKNGPKKNGPAKKGANQRPPKDGPPDAGLPGRLAACRLCAERFAKTETAHSPAPVVWFRPGARILIAGQAPGLRVHNSGKPFTDPSGDRLRHWLGLDETVFYDRDRVAIVPAAFCFPGYDARGADLPPPRICGATWHDAVMAHLGDIPLKILIGGHAHRLHLGLKGPVTAAVKEWRRHAPAVFLLPHPSWRNTGWISRNPWFETEILPALRRAVTATLG